MPCNAKKRKEYDNDNPAAGGKVRRTGSLSGVRDLRTSLEVLGITNETVLIHEFKREYIQIQRYIHTSYVHTVIVLDDL